MTDWTSPPMPLGFISFAPGSGGLHFTDDPGCGPREVVETELLFALHDCRTQPQVTRELGVSLGMARTNQRIERDRYLEVADASQFSDLDACDGNVFDKCDNASGYPTDLGPFEPQSVMMGSGVSRSGAGCDLLPNGARLFSRRDRLDSRATLPCESDVPMATVPTVRDKSSFVELYSLYKGWSPFRVIPGVMGAASSPEYVNMPIPTGVGGNLRAVGDPALMAEGDGYLEIYTFADDGTLRQNGYDPRWLSWGTWIPFAPQPPFGAIRAVSAVSPSKGIWHNDGQLVMERALAITAVGAVLVVHLPNDAQWVVLGAPPSGVSSAPAIARGASARLDVFVVANDGSLWSRDSSGAGWSSWHSAPPQPNGVTFVGQPAIHYDDQSDTIGAAVRASNGSLWFATRAHGLSWSAWLNLDDSGGTGVGGPAVVATSEGFRVFVRGAEGFLWQRTGIGITSASFEALGGVLAARPTADSSQTHGIDVVSPMISPSTQLPSLWHRQAGLLLR